MLDSCVPSLIATCEFPRFYPTSRYGDLWLCGTAFFLFTRGFFCEAIFFWMWVNCSNICHVAANGSLAMQSSKMALLHTNPLGKMLQFTHIEWIQQSKNVYIYIHIQLISKFAHITLLRCKWNGRRSLMTGTWSGKRGNGHLWRLWGPQRYLEQAGQPMFVTMRGVHCILL